MRGRWLIKNVYQKDQCRSDLFNYQTSAIGRRLPPTRVLRESAIEENSHSASMSQQRFATQYRYS